MDTRSPTWMKWGISRCLQINNIRSATAYAHSLNHTAWLIGDSYNVLGDLGLKKIPIKLTAD